MAEGIAAPAWGVGNRDTPLLTKFQGEAQLVLPLVSRPVHPGISSKLPSCHVPPSCLQPEATLNWGPQVGSLSNPRPHVCVQKCQPAPAPLALLERVFCEHPTLLPASARAALVQRNSQLAPVLLFQQAHPAPVSGAREVGWQTCPGPSPGASLPSALSLQRSPSHRRPPRGTGSGGEQG